MTFFFLPQQHYLTLETLPDGRFFPENQLFWGYQIPYYCVLSLCQYTGDWDKDHSWKNKTTNKVYETIHPLGLEYKGAFSSSFTDDFYEIIKIEGLTFGEGEALCPKTFQKIRVEKPNPRFIWNPFLQRWDPPCDCWLNSGKIKKEMSSSSGRGSYMHFDRFVDCENLFFAVYCSCGMRDNREHHTDSDSD